MQSRDSAQILTVMATVTLVIAAAIFAGQCPVHAQNTNEQGQNVSSGQRIVCPINVWISPQDRSNWLKDIEKDIQSIWAKDTSLRSDKEVGCSFNVNRLGQIDSLQAYPQSQDPVDSKEQAAAFSIIKKATPFKFARWPHPHKDKLPLSITFLNYPHFVMRLLPGSGMPPYSNYVPSPEPGAIYPNKQ
jgi:hypothetical protein